MMDYEDIKIQIVDTPPLADNTPAWLYAIYRSGDIILIIMDASDENLLFQFEKLKEKLTERNIIFDNPDLANIKAIIILNKIDYPNAQNNIEPFLEKYNKQLPVVSISTLTGEHIAILKKELFQKLSIIRVYTKKIGELPVRKEPIVLKTGTTVIEAAEYIHKDFKKNLQFTKLWNDSGYNGQRVEKSHILKDGDIIEFHV